MIERCKRTKNGKKKREKNWVTKIKKKKRKKKERKKERSQFINIYIFYTGLTQSRDSRSRARRGIKLRNESEPKSLKAGIESEHVNRITSFITRDRSKWQRNALTDVAEK